MAPDEIIARMEKFTPDECDRITLLAAGKVENITMEDMELFSRWKTSNALAEAQFEAEREATYQVAQAEIEQRAQVADAAMKNLEAQAELAYARLEAVKNGKI